MATQLTNAAHEAGERALQEVVTKATKAGVNADNLLMHITPVRRGLRAVTTAEEMVGFSKGFTEALGFGYRDIDLSTITLLRDAMRTYVEAVYRVLGIKDKGQLLM